MSELQMVVDRLTVETRQVVHTASGPVIVVARPVLAELRAALHPSGEPGSGGGASVGSGAPLDVTALSLMCRVQDEVAHLQWLARSTPGVLTPRLALGGMSLEERIRWTAGVLDGGPSEAEMLAAARSWARAVDRLLDPPKVVSLRGVACPACGVAKTPVLDDAGEFVDAAALSITMGTQPWARCGECGAEWRGAEVVDLARQVGASPAVAHLLGG